MVSEGRLSIGRAAELLDLSYYDIYRITQAKGIELGATEEQYEQGRKHAVRLKSSIQRPKLRQIQEDSPPPGPTGPG